MNFNIFHNAKKSVKSHKPVPLSNQAFMELLFNKFDANQNGYISTTEFTNILHYLAKLTKSVTPNR